MAKDFLFTIEKNRKTWFGPLCVSTSGQQKFVSPFLKSWIPHCSWWSTLFVLHDHLELILLLNGHLNIFMASHLELLIFGHFWNHTQHSCNYFRISSGRHHIKLYSVNHMLQRCILALPTRTFIHSWIWKEVGPFFSINQAPLSIHLYQTGNWLCPSDPPWVETSDALS